MTDKRILVAEANRAVGAALRKYLESAGFAVETVEGFEDALGRLRAWSPDLLICGVIGLDGQTLCRKAKELAPGLPVVILYPPDDEAPESRAVEAGADSLMVGPIKRANVVAAVQTLLQVRELQGQISELQLELERRISAPSARSPQERESQVDFDFFKRLLLMEVKRSRRYRYPLSFLMVAVDGFAETVGRLDPRAQGRFMGQLLGVAVKSVRDIDLCVLYAQDKFLIFLPHTDQAGAMIVAGRLRERVEDFGGGPKVTCSIGVAAYDGSGATVSFGGLLKDATTALRKAQAGGGNRVEAGERQKPRARVSIG